MDQGQEKEDLCPQGGKKEGQRLQSKEGHQGREEGAGKGETTQGGAPLAAPHNGALSAQTRSSPPSPATCYCGPWATFLTLPASLPLPPPPPHTEASSGQPHPTFPPALCSSPAADPEGTLTSLSLPVASKFTPTPALTFLSIPLASLLSSQDLRRCIHFL